jgi:hypothetical protein
MKLDDKIMNWIHTCRNRYKMSYREIAADLNKRGFITEEGKPFNRMTVWRILNEGD